MKYQFATFVTGLLLMFNPFVASAQVTVTGTVTNAESGNTLPSVNIVLKGTQRGTATDANGRYTITIPSGQDSLVFSFVGFEKQVVPVKGRSTVDVLMQPNVEQLNDMVVIGYGTQKKEDKTGSITEVSSDDFNQGSITSPQDLLVGKAAGVNVTPNGGAPGSGATIRIRGGSSLAASNDPLYVIDGVPVDDSGISGMRNPLNTINPNDIASVSILKDASATAIYGSRASNGVIIITTKKGHAGQGLNVNYTGKATYQTDAKHIDVLSADQFRNVITSKFGQQGTQYLGERSTDWQDQIFKNVFSQDHSLSLSGAAGVVPFRASMGYSGDNGILRTSRLDRLTGSISLNPTFFNDRLKVNANLKGVRVHNRFANQGAIGNAVRFDPTQPVRVGNSDAKYGGYYTWVDGDGNRIPIAPTNPVALLNQRNDRSTVYRSIGNLKLDYDLPFITGLSANVNLGYDYSKVGNGLITVPTNAAFEDDGSVALGLRSDYTQNKKNELLDAYANYTKDVASIQSTIDFTAGYSWERHYQDGTSYSTNFKRADTTIVDANTDYKTEYYIISFFGRLNYSLMNKYLFTATLRSDGTSRFSKDNRWGLFPSGALAWKMQQEPFLRNLDVVSQLKLRLSFGITGQQRIGQGDYPYLGTYTYGEPTADYQFGNNFVTTLRPEGYNKNLKWEQTATYNVGIDYGFFDNRLSGSIEGYFRKTTDLLNVVPVPAGTNFTNRILSNVGSLEVRGVEFSVTGVPVSTENVNWQLSLNASHNQDKITKLTNVNDPNYKGVQTGGIQGGTGNTIQINSVGYPRNSFYVYQQVYDENGNPLEGVYVDHNDDGMINEDDKYRYKSPTPDATMGISSRVKYKSWDAAFSGRLNLGNYVYNNVASSNAFYSDMLYTQYIRNAPTSIYETNFNNEQFFSDYYVENASFFRMDNITVGYTFNRLFDNDVSLRLSGTVQNPFVITNYSGLDPEIFGGIDSNLYPRPRSFVFGLNLNF